MTKQLFIKVNLHEGRYGYEPATPEQIDAAAGVTELRQQRDGLLAAAAMWDVTAHKCIEDFNNVVMVSDASVALDYIYHRICNTLAAIAELEAQLRKALEVVNNDQLAALLAPIIGDRRSVDFRLGRGVRRCAFGDDQMTVQLIQGDCLELIKDIPSGAGDQAGYRR